MRRDVVERDLAVQSQLAAYAAEYPKLQAKYEADLAAWQSQADAAKAAGSPGPRKPKPSDPPGLSVGGDGVARDLVGARYSLKIEPVVGYGIRGFLWDQGENGTGIGGVDMALPPEYARECYLHEASARSGGAERPLFCMTPLQGRGC